jgi:hypothetical protein
MAKSERKPKQNSTTYASRKERKQVWSKKDRRGPADGATYVGSKRPIKDLL